MRLQHSYQRIAMNIRVGFLEDEGDEILNTDGSVEDGNGGDSTRERKAPEDGLVIYLIRIPRLDAGI